MVEWRTRARAAGRVRAQQPHLGPRRPDQVLSTPIEWARRSTLDHAGRAPGGDQPTVRPVPRVDLPHPPLAALLLPSSAHFIGGSDLEHEVELMAVLGLITI
jgi:hypothetical protein